MKQNEWNEGINGIDPALVEKYFKQKDKYKQRKKRRSAFLRFGTIAACFAVIVGAVWALPMMWESGNSTKTDSTTSENTTTEPQVTLPAVPVWNNTLYSADELAKLFGFDKPANTDSTGNYSEVFVSSRDSFKNNLNPIPDSDYMGIYKFNADAKELNEEELNEFANRIIPKLSRSINEEILKEDKSMDYDWERHLYYYRYKNYEVQIFHKRAYTATHISLSLESRDKNFVFDGEEVIIDREKSDAEILESLESIKGKLFEIFGVSFSEADVIRDSYGLRVRYYNRAAPDLFPTKVYPDSDYIEISRVVIVYAQSRSPDSRFYSLVSNERKISLEEAEALLFNGYCFGFHFCPACARDMEAISFEDYDFVEMKYMFCTSGGDPSIGIPFYVFYKEKSTNGKGGIVYAQTYVPAIEIGGYEEYFRNQEQKHNFNNK